MRLLGLAGWSGSGKTTLITLVLPLLRAHGLRVSTIKHAHHALDLDQPGKDSFRHRQAGAEEVLVVGGARWALLRECPDVPPDPLDLAARLAPVDLVLLEGFKTATAIEKLEIHRPSLGKPSLWPDHGAILAVATDAPVECPYPLLPLNDAPAIARWMLAFARSPGPRA